MSRKCSRRSIMEKVDINCIDTRFESYRLIDKNKESALVGSIVSEDIRDPLQCIQADNNTYILLDGFKRLRCAKTLSYTQVPIKSLGNDEVLAILALIRMSLSNNLNLLEEAVFIDALYSKHNLSHGEIAQKLERSISWVSMRLGIMGEISATIKDALFSGKFPVRSYMYTIRHFTRVKKVSKNDVDTFVQIVSGKDLSTRDIDTLAYGYFNGGTALRDQIKQGKLVWTLKQMRKSYAELTGESGSMSEKEKRTIKNMELAQKYMKRVQVEIQDRKLQSNAFHSLAQLLCEGILINIYFFTKRLKEYNAKRKYS